MKYSIVIGNDCIAIFINGSLDFACAKQYYDSGLRLVEHMRLLQSMGYSLESIEYKIDYVFYD